MTETVEKCRGRAFPAALAGRWLSRHCGDLTDDGDFWGKKCRQSPGEMGAPTAAEPAGR